MRKVKVAALQFSCSKDVQENINKAEKMVKEAADNGANIILLPELFERQYFCQEKRYDYYNYALPLEKNPAVNRFKEVAKELGVVIPVSFYERDIDRLFNTVAMIDADGSVLGIYRKTHIPVCITEEDLKGYEFEEGEDTREVGERLAASLY